MCVCARARCCFYGAGCVCDIVSMARGVWAVAENLRGRKTVFPQMPGKREKGAKSHDLEKKKKESSQSEGVLRKLVLTLNASGMICWLKL